MGRCCAIPRKYLIREEIYPVYEDSLDWIRTQRQGRENTGIMFVGPVLLRDGQWYAAEICMSPNNPDEDGGDGICDCKDVNDPDAYVCADTDDEEYCYLDVGIPGTGKWQVNKSCNEACTNAFNECEFGCSDCNCCYEEPPPPGPDGIACSYSVRLLTYGALKDNYPEILTDAFCQAGGLAAELAREGGSGIREDSVLVRLMEYVIGLGFEPADIFFASFRSADPNECRVELWGMCSCESCGPDGPIPKFLRPTGNMEAGDGFGGDVEQMCACQQKECDKFCYDAEELGVDIVDEWQAQQIGAIEWKDDKCPLGCYAPCDYSVLPPEVPYTQNSTSDASGISLNVADTSYERTQQAPPPDSFEWNPDWNSDGLIEDLVWYKEEVFSNAAYFDSGDPETGASHCVKYTLVACNRAAMAWEDVTKDAIIGKPGFVTVAAEDYPVDDITDWGLTVITNFITDIGTVIEGCSQMPTVQDMPWYDVGQMDFPITYEEPIRMAQTKTKNLKGGAGTELKKLLAWFGIEAKEQGCKCKSRAAKMDKNGIEWCANNVEKIVDWLKEEAQRRKLPFIRSAAKVIVLRAIRNARKEAAR